MALPIDPVPAADSQKQRGQTAYRVFWIPPVVPAPATGTQGAAQPGYSAHPEEMDIVKAANSNAALKAVAEKHGTGVYVAVPESSWKPQKVTVEQTTVVKVGEPA